ncbi:MAG TPA: YciI-like protein [Anaeromyxobacter sp.]
MYFALLYDVVPGYAERRRPLRAAHLALAGRFAADGKLLLGGAFDPPDGALLVFRAGSAAEVEAFVREDPYVANGLVTAWRVKPWTVVTGRDAVPG